MNFIMVSSPPFNFSLPISPSVDWPSDLSFLAPNESQPSEWGADAEGKLSVDVAETADEVLVVAPMAGAPPANVELHLYNDLLTIRAERDCPVPVDANYFHQECYWGKFSRSIVLPVDVRAELAEAQYKNGVLLIRLPKTKVKSEIPLMVIEE